MMTTQRTFEPHEFEAYTEAENICRHCDRGKYAVHHQQTEFDQVFNQIEAPEYPATCDNCGEVGTNASMEQHVCTNEHHNTPAAPERGEWSYHEGEDYIVVLGSAHDITDNPIANVYEVEYARQIVTEHNQHSTLMAQRERLLATLRQARNAARVFTDSKYLETAKAGLRQIVLEIDSVLTTSEQEERRER